MGEGQNEILGEGVNHGECQLIVVVLPEYWIYLHVPEDIVHPAHVPLIIETESAQIGRTGYHRPAGRLFGHGYNTFKLGVYHFIEFFSGSV